MFAPVPFSPHPPFSTSQGSGPTYTIVCSVGTFTLTGQSLGIITESVIPLDAGLFALTGQDATFTFTPPTKIVIDTHDDVRRTKKRDAEFKASQKRLHRAVARAFGVEFADEQEPALTELREVAKPFVYKDSERIQIDWQRIEADLHAKLRLQEAWFAYQRELELEADDEETILLLH